MNLPSYSEGIDVAMYQNIATGAIDWIKVAASGKSFVMVRALGNGKSVDPYFYENVRGAKAAGLRVGVYYFTYAISEAEVIGELQIVLNAMQTLENEGIRFDYPIAVDMESNKFIDKLTVQERTHLLRFALTILDQRGYYPMIYTGTHYANTQLDMSQLAGIDVWIADYRANLGYRGPHTMWQYSSKGTVPGISGNVDLNHCYVNYPHLIMSSGKNHWK